MLTHIAQFITYMAYSGIILICLYFIYKLFLCNTAHHGFNRLYLMLSYVVAFALLPLRMFLTMHCGNRSHTPTVREYPYQTLTPSLFRNGWYCR